MRRIVAEPRERFLFVLVLLTGALLMLAAGQLALQMPRTWQISDTNMDSKLNPNDVFAVYLKDSTIRLAPIRTDIPNLLATSTPAPNPKPNSVAPPAIVDFKPPVQIATTTPIQLSSPTRIPSETAAASDTALPTLTTAATATETLAPTATASDTPLPTPTRTRRPPTGTPTRTRTPVPTNVPFTATPTRTVPPSATATPVVWATNINPPMPTRPPVNTATPNPTASISDTPVVVPTDVPTAIPTNVTPPTPVTPQPTPVTPQPTPVTPQPTTVTPPPTPVTPPPGSCAINGSGDYVIPVGGCTATYSAGTLGGIFTLDLTTPGTVSISWYGLPENQNSGSSGACGALNTSININRTINNIAVWKQQGAASLTIGNSTGKAMTINITVSDWISGGCQ